jgi:hypothetical protein
MARVCGAKTVGGVGRQTFGYTRIIKKKLEKQFLQKLRGLARNCRKCDDVIVENAFKHKGVHSTQVCVYSISSYL